MNNATPIGQLPYIPQQGSNDPRVMNEVMNDVRRDYPQGQQQVSGGLSGGSDTISDPVIKEVLMVIVLYVLLNSEFVNNLLLQYIPTMVQISEPHLQTTVIKAAGFGAVVYIIKKYLM